jgi:tetratricopeptide (TPR) repeat protein
MNSRFFFTLITLLANLAILWSEGPAKSPSETKLRLQAQSMSIEGEGKRSTSLGSSGSIIAVPCPLCKSTAQYYNLKPSFPDKGMDRDFCKHYREKSHYDLDVWTCTECGYSNHKSFFHQAPSLTEDERKELKGSLVSSFIQQFGLNISKLGHKIDQEDIPTNIKYRLMLSLLEKLDLPWKAKADFHLNYAWTERLRLCAPIAHPSLSTSISAINKRLTLFEKSNHLKNVISDPTQVLDFIYQHRRDTTDPTHLFLLALYEASQLDRLGYTPKAAELLKQAILMSTEGNYKSIAQFKHSVLMSEISQLKEAVIAIKEAIKHDEYHLNELISATYLLGELQRRIGLAPEAAAWLELCISLDHQPLSQWSQEQIKKCPKTPGMLPDGEKLLIQKASYAIQQQQLRTKLDFDPRNISEDRASTWTKELHMAAVHYNREYRLDPESLSELHQLGFLKGQPNLGPEALRFFKLIIDKQQRLSSLRYQIDCLVPFSDQSEHYLYTFKKGQLHKVPAKTL